MTGWTYLEEKESNDMFAGNVKQWGRYYGAWCFQMCLTQVDRYMIINYILNGCFDRSTAGRSPERAFSGGELQAGVRKKPGVEMKSQNSFMIAMLVLFAAVPCLDVRVLGGTIRSGQYYTWGIDTDKAAVPEGSVITEAVVTIHNLTSSSDNANDSLCIYLLDEPRVDFIADTDDGGNPFEEQGVRMVRVHHAQSQGGQDVAYTFSELDVEYSPLWEHFGFPLVFGPAERPMVIESSLILDLIDYAGGGTSFGLGFDTNGNTDYNFDEITLELVVESFGDELESSSLVISTTGNTSIVGYWAMDDNAASRFVADRSGNGNDGTSVQQTSISHRVSSFNGALSFDGAGDYIDLGQGGSLDDLPADDFTVSAWIYDESATGKEIIMGVFPDGTAGWILRKQGMGTGLYIDFWAAYSTNNAYFATPAGSLESDSWHHVAAVWQADTKTCMIYIDGSESSYVTALAGKGEYNSDASYPKEIGRMAYIGGIQFFEGMMDEVKIFNRTLSAVEVAALGSEAGSLDEVELFGPVADAGRDQVVADADGDGSEIVTLDASGSTAAGGVIAGYVWTEGGEQIATGVSPTVSLSVGSHIITLGVVDDSGFTDTDTLTVTVFANPDGLIGYWAMDDNDSSQLVADSSGNGNDGTSVRPTSVLQSTGSLDGALIFDGIGDYIDLGQGGLLDDLPADDFTVSAWIYDESASGKGMIMGVYPSGTAGWVLRVQRRASGGYIDFWAGHSTANAYFVTPGGSLTSNDWHHIAAVWEAATKTCRLYIDGTEQPYLAADAGEGSYNSDASYDKEIGRMGYMDGIQFFDGKMDEVKVFNQALSPEEVRELHSQAAEADLVAYWRMDENEADVTVADSSGNGCDGTAQQNTSTLHIAGMVDGALYFNGGGDYVDMALPDGLTDLPAGDFTVSAWIYDESATGKGMIMGVFPDGTTGWILRKQRKVSGGYIDFWAGHSTTDAYFATPAGSLASDSWHHVAAVWDAAAKMCRIYIDGSESSYVTSTAGEGSYNSDASYDKEIGRMAYIGGIQFFEGIMDEVKVFSRVLSGEEILELADYF